MSHQDGCGGGCFWGRSQLSNMMHSHERSRRWGSACAWGPPTDRDRNGCMYNEVVLDGTEWKDHLPHVIEAVFYPVNGHVDHREGDESAARSIHYKFLESFGLNGVGTPLLSFDVHKAQHSNTHPFVDTGHLLSGTHNSSQ